MKKEFLRNIIIFFVCYVAFIALFNFSLERIFFTTLIFIFLVLPTMIILSKFGKKIRKEEEKIKKCLCDIPYCAKCLAGNCQDDNCKVHTIPKKIRARKYFLPNVKDKKERQEWIAEIKRLENSPLNKTK